MLTIDKDRAIELLEQAVAQRGADYTYPHPTCEYTVRDSQIDVDPHPACIVGVALSLAGVPLAELVKLEGDVSELRTDRQRFPLSFHLTKDAMDAWLAARVVQDGAFGRDDRGTWGDALAAAKAALADPAAKAALADPS